MILTVRLKEFENFGVIHTRETVRGQRTQHDLDVTGLELAAADLEAIFAVDPAAWSAEADQTEEYFDIFGDRLSPQMTEQLTALRARLAEAE